MVSLSEIATKPVPALSLLFTDADMQAFLTLSGDDNPLHLDDDFARARGFAGRIVYGGLIVAAVSRLLGTVVPGHGCVWHSLKMDFRNPLYIDEVAELTASVAHVSPELGVVQLGLRVACADRVVAEGKVQALMRS